MGNRSEDTTPAFLTDYRARAPFKAAVTRRRFLLGGAAAAGVAVAGSAVAAWFAARPIGRAPDAVTGRRKPNLSPLGCRLSPAPISRRPICGA